METKVDLPKIWVNSLVNVIQRRHEGVLTCQLFSKNPQGLILLLRGPAQRSFSLQPNSWFKLTPVWMTDVPEREGEYSQLLLLREALPLRWVWASPTQSFKITGWLVLERRLKRHSKASRRQNNKAVLLTAEGYSQDNTMLLPLGGIYGSLNSAEREGGRCFLARSKAKASAAFYLCSHINKFSIKYVLQGKWAKCAPQRTH